MSALYARLPTPVCLRHPVYVRMSTSAYIGPLFTSVCLRPPVYAVCIGPSVYVPLSADYASLSTPVCLHPLYTSVCPRPTIYARTAYARSVYDRLSTPVPTPVSYANLSKTDSLRPSVNTRLSTSVCLRSSIYVCMSTPA